MMINRRRTPKKDRTKKSKEGPIPCTTSTNNTDDAPTTDDAPIATATTAATDSAICSIIVDPPRLDATKKGPKKTSRAAAPAPTAGPPKKPPPKRRMVLLAKDPSPKRMRKATKLTIPSPPEAEKTAKKAKKAKKSSQRKRSKPRAMDVVDEESPSKSLNALVPKSPSHNLLPDEDHGSHHNDTTATDDASTKQNALMTTTINATTTTSITNGGTTITSTPAAKFQFRQRVYARDTETAPGMLCYEGVVRRVMYGTHHQRQLRLSTKMTPNEIDSALLLQDQDESETWWYFIHYNGWNVKWDRWVEEQHLYEVTESTKAFCDRLHEEVKAIRKSGTKKGATVAAELECRMVQIETDHRLAERKRMLAATNNDDHDDDSKARLLAKEQKEVANLRSGSKPPSKCANTDKWSKKANLIKEMALRRDHQMQGRRSQATSELLVLPFALKKILVEEWEIISQCKGMLAILPAVVPVRQALMHYLDQKLEHLNGTSRTKKEEQQDSQQNDNEANKETSSAIDPITSKPEPSTASTEKEEEDKQGKDEMEAETKDPSDPSENKARSFDTTPPDTMLSRKITAIKPNQKISDQEREWREMVDGVCLFFDQALPKRLLYQSEQIQHQILMEGMSTEAPSDEKDDKAGNGSIGVIQTNSDIYGCEFLLRLFLRLPSLLVGELSEPESKSILAKLNDLVRYLQKQQDTIFTQSYRRWSDVELLRRKEEEE